MEPTSTTIAGKVAAEAGLLDLLLVLARRWRLVLRVALGAAAVAAVTSLLWPSKYTSVTTFVPETSSPQLLPPGVAGLAGELGFSLGGGATTSPRFFADVLKSRGLMEQMLNTRFQVAAGDRPLDSLPLLQLLPVDGDNRLDSLEDGRRELAKRMRIVIDAETNIIALSITTSNRELAPAVANRFLVYLDEFNSTTRQSKAREQRQFVEAQLEASGTELKAAEGNLQSFYEKNRTWQQSPSLGFQEGQLRRRVDVLQEVYLTLSREFERARIDQVNDTPAITVIDSAVPTQDRISPKPGLVAGMTFVLAAMLGVVAVLVAEYSTRLEAHDAEGYARLRALLPSFWRRT